MPLLVLHAYLVHVGYAFFAIGILLFHEVHVLLIEKEAFGIFSDQFSLIVAHHLAETVICADDLVIRIDLQQTQFHVLDQAPVLLLALANPFLNVPDLCDIPGHTSNVHETTLSVILNIEFLAQPSGPPGKRGHWEFKIGLFFFCPDRQLVQANDLFSFIGVQKLAEVFSKQRLHRNTQYLFARRIHIGEPPFFVQVVNDITCTFDQTFIRFLAPFELFCALTDLIFQLPIEGLEFHIVLVQLKCLLFQNALSCFSGKDLTLDPAIE
ncbi:MAG: Uncharacterised protein [Flavobacteriia bacterium]|nr:MAG: Uncharacterised protein [Flavobacteriia bacterium]